MKTRIKLPAITATLTTREEAESVMNDHAAITNNQRKLLAARDAEVLGIKNKYEPGLTACAEDIKRATELLRAWADANPDQFPKDRKTIKMTSGEIGFRTGTPKLAPIGRVWTWEKILKSISAAGILSWIRKKEEVDKDAILREHSQASDKPTLDQCLKGHGIKVVQDESFFAEPDLSTFETRQTI